MQCPASAQVLISDEQLVSLSAADLVAQGVFTAQHGVTVHKLVYATTDPFGEPTVASGALVLPDTPECYHSMVCYMHGTILEREGVPSRLSQEILIGYFMGGSGYVAVLPDYLGLGDSPGMHPYIHAASEASASVDMMRAAREFCEARSVQLNGQLFLVGYSQGGHACLATHRMIEAELSDEFTVTASAPASGPYDVSGVQAAVIVADDPYPAPYYLPYVLFGLGSVYTDLYDEVIEVLKEPWATDLPPLFDGNYPASAVDALMPEVPSQIIQDELLEAFIADPDHPFRVALREQDLYDWAPQAPTRMYYCEADDHVFYRNSIVALNGMTDNGATSVQAISAGADQDHSGCVYPSLLSAKLWFDSLQGECGWNGIGEPLMRSWAVHPNPAVDRVRITAQPPMPGRWPWTLHDATGRQVAEGMIEVDHAGAELLLPRTASGMHLLRITGPEAAMALRLMIEPRDQ